MVLMVLGVRLVCVFVSKSGVRFSYLAFLLLVLHTTRAIRVCVRVRVRVRVRPPLRGAPANI